MKHIWASEIRFKPAGPLTFRQMPSGLLHIMTYPFMPPTTMSGFLKRLLMIAEGGEWTGYGEDWYGKGPGKEFTLTLEKEYRALGAFPPRNGWSIHKTRRHGPKSFKHTEFSQILRESHKENYQLHHWDYLFCEEMTGWVTAKEKEFLERLAVLKNFGGKAGKEGWLTVVHITEPKKLSLENGDFKPLGLVTPPTRPDSGMFFNLYGHYWDENYEWRNGEKGGVTGYTQLGAWWNAGTVNGLYWAWEKSLGFPVHVPDDFLKAEGFRFFEDRQTD